MKNIVEFVKKHPQSTITFDYDSELDHYSVNVRDFELNKAWSQKFDGVNFEDNPNRITQYALNVAEKEIYQR